MKVAIVGAGAAGLAAARTLSQAGQSVKIFEQSRALGGRAATRRIQAFTFDHGATSIAPRGLSLEKVMMEELDTSGLVEVTLPIYVHDGFHIRPGDSARNGVRRYCYSDGLSRLGKLLGEGLDIRLDSQVERLEIPRDGGFSLRDEWFDAVILAIPTPHAEALLSTAGMERPLRNVHYRSCISVMLGFEVPFSAPYHALIEPEQQQPLTWLSIESLKCPGHAPEGGTALVAQLSPSYSRRLSDQPDERIIRETLVDISRLIGQQFSKPAVSAVHHWQLSQPESTALFEAVNPQGTHLVVAGDGVRGGRIELAYESGVQAAQHLLAL